ncbi:MAG TPA: beta-propeller fold lactonase family protein, partial [Micromonospora sp.]|nr:beta-propeller fold lactonase family protein [Micromonospora sp.]
MTPRRGVGLPDGSGLLYIGCYTAESGGRGEGILALQRDPVGGAVEPVGVVAVTPSPSFLTRHPTLPVLYAVNELDDGFVSAWSLAPDATLHALARRSTGGAEPCHLAVTADSRHLVTANYGSGSLAVHPLDPVGVPGERSDLVTHDNVVGTPAEERRSERQDGPHAHMVSPGPDGVLLAVDLGVDSIYRYDVAPTGQLLPRGPRLRTRPGSGPR